MIQVLVNGCNGKMGQEVIDVLDNFPNFILRYGFDRENRGDFTFPVVTSFEEITEKPDIAIDFSVPSATFLLLEYAVKVGMPVVIATTGFTSEEEEKINDYAKQIPIFKSANMSYEINVMKKLVALATKALQGSDIEITETHHNRKIDSPSRNCFITRR